MISSKCTMTGCGKQPTHTVVLSIPEGVATERDDVSRASLMDAATFPACAEHVDHVAKVFYGAAYALSGTVTTSTGARASDGRAAARG